MRNGGDLAPAPPAPLSPAGKAALATEVLMVYARARWGLRRGDIRDTLAQLRPAGTAAGTESANEVDHPAALRLGRAVARVLTPVPADSRCLMQSLVLCGVLARRGVPSSVVIAVRPGSDFGAHAWVELDGRPLLPTGEGDFERLVTL